MSITEKKAKNSYRAPIAILLVLSLLGAAVWLLPHLFGEGDSPPLTRIPAENPQSNSVSAPPPTDPPASRLEAAQRRVISPERSTADIIRESCAQYRAQMLEEAESLKRLALSRPDVVESAKVVLSEHFQRAGIVPSGADRRTVVWCADFVQSSSPQEIALFVLSSLKENAARLGFGEAQNHGQRLERLAAIDSRHDPEAIARSLANKAVGEVDPSDRYYYFEDMVFAESLPFALIETRLLTSRWELTSTSEGMALIRSIVGGTGDSSAEEEMPTFDRVCEWLYLSAFIDIVSRSGTQHQKLMWLAHRAEFYKLPYSIRNQLRKSVYIRAGNYSDFLEKLSGADSGALWELAHNYFLESDDAPDRIFDALEAILVTRGWRDARSAVNLGLGMAMYGLETQRHQKMLDAVLARLIVRPFEEWDSYERALYLLQLEAIGRIIGMTAVRQDQLIANNAARVQWERAYRALDFSNASQESKTNILGAIERIQLQGRGFEGESHIGDALMLCSVVFAATRHEALRVNQSLLQNNPTVFEDHPPALMQYFPFAVYRFPQPIGEDDAAILQSQARVVADRWMKLEADPDLRHAYELYTPFFALSFLWMGTQELPANWLADSDLRSFILHWYGDSESPRQASVNWKSGKDWLANQR